MKGFSKEDYTKAIEHLGELADTYAAHTESQRAKRETAPLSERTIIDNSIAGSVEVRGRLLHAQACLADALRRRSRTRPKT